MRFAATHKVVSYLMISTAFLVLALSGELAIPITLLTAVGIITSFFFDPQRHRFLQGKPYNNTLTVLLALIFAESVLEYIQGEALISLGTRFLCALLVAKVWSRNSNRDYMQAYIISFFMLVAGAVLNNNVVYALCFLAYVVFATWTLTLFHLRREMEENYLLKHVPSKDGKAAESERVEVDRILNSRRVVGKEFLLGSSLVSLGIFACSVVIFIITPRVGLGLDLRLRGKGVSTSGFSENIELGGHGLIRTNPQVVLRIEMPQKPPVALRFRGVSFDRYDKGRWSRSESTARRSFYRTGRYYFLPREGLPLSGNPPRVAIADVERALAGTLSATVNQDLDTSAIFLPPGTVAVVPLEAPYLLNPLALGPSDEVFARDRRAALRYTFHADTRERTPEVLYAAKDLPEEHELELDRYLRLPQTVPPRLRALAEQITRGARGPHHKASLIQEYLRKNLGYTTNLGRDDKFEPLEDFLFVQKKGHCEYFASAMAVMLRVVGVPSRSVNGYLGGEWNDLGRYLAVRQADAHAWVEAYLPGVGWQTYDPTPPAGQEPLAGGLLDRVRQIVDVVELNWFRYVVEYDLRAQIRMAEGLRNNLREQRRRGKELGLDLRGTLTRAAGSPITRALLVLLAGGAIVWFGRGRGGGGGDGGARRRDQQLLRPALQALQRRGFTQAGGETLQALGRRVEERGDPTGPPFLVLVRRYYESRFGQKDVPAAELRGLARAVSQAEREARRADKGRSPAAGPAAGAAGAGRSSTALDETLPSGRSPRS